MGIKNSLDNFNIAGISPGRKFASGTATSDGSALVTVTGLSFKPTVIRILINSGVNYNLEFAYVDANISSTIAAWANNAGTFNGNRTIANPFTSNGFSIGMSTTGTLFKWIAYE